MKRDVLAKSIKQIINEHLNSSTYNDENLFLTKDLHISTLDKFEILNKIEKKHRILINDETIIWENDLTIREYIDKIFEQTQK